MDPKDRTTAIVFADGAGAVVLRAGSEGELGAIGPFDLGSDGTQCHLLGIPAGGARQRGSGIEAQPEDFYFHMQGREVFRQAVLRMADSARNALTRAGWSTQDLDRFVPHQANARISAAVADRLGIDPTRLLSNIESVGNTSAASIPLLLAEAAIDGRLERGQRVLLAAFGGGLTWGATTLRWPQIASLSTFLPGDKRPLDKCGVPSDQ